jgi:four helix bundle protein
MSTTNHYRDLVIWQKAMELVPAVYQLLTRLPSEETYALADQIRRATVSIPANIAEGKARQHTKEFLQHLTVARGSLAELETLLEISQRLGYITPPQLDRILHQTTDLARSLNALIAALRKKLTPSPQPPAPNP